MSVMLLTGRKQMCYEVTYKDQTYETVRELRLIASVLVEDPRYALPLDDDACLCQVDLEATAAQNGFTHSTIRNDPMRVLWKKEEAMSQTKEVCRECEIVQGEDCVTLCPLHAAAQDLRAA